MLKFTPDTHVEPVKGSLLLAEPFMDDPYFQRKVILLCEHNDEGSFGFVLNNYIDLTINDLMEEFPQFFSRVSVGGPVKNSNLYYIHTLGQQLEGSVAVTENIYMGGDFEQLKELARKGQIPDDEVRFFVGYAGWSAGQLKSEINNRSWFITEADEPLLMDTSGDEMWATMIGRMGKEYAHLANTPNDPSLN